MRNSPEFPVCFIWKRFALNSSRFLSLTLTHKGSIQGILCTAEAQFSAHHTGCGSFPHVVHDGPPLSVSEHLHATLAQPGAGLQSHRLQRGNNGGNKPSDPHVKVMNTCVWLCLRRRDWMYLTTAGWGAWGLPEEMRANWGPGTHFTTACLPFLQGLGLRGMDSWARHSDRQFSVPRQWTFSTQNPFFFDMRLNLERRQTFVVIYS